MSVSSCLRMSSELSNAGTCTLPLLGGDSWRWMHFPFSAADKRRDIVEEKPQGSLQGKSLGGVQRSSLSVDRKVTRNQTLEVSRGVHLSSGPFHKGMRAYR